MFSSATPRSNSSRAPAEKISSPHVQQQRSFSNATHATTHYRRGAVRSGHFRWERLLKKPRVSSRISPRTAMWVCCRMAPLRIYRRVRDLMECPMSLFPVVP